IFNNFIEYIGSPQLTVMKSSNLPSPMSRQELAHQLSISYPTLLRLIKPYKSELGLSRKLLTPMQVYQICIKIKYPIPIGYNFTNAKLLDI
ncbi:MAG: hypothetical protein AAFO07_22475, partial [Bacteroidota bacterium]